MTPYQLSAILLVMSIHSCSSYECNINATVCETSLVIDHMLTMTHPQHRALWAKNGKVYKLEDINATLPIDYELAITADGYVNGGFVNYRRVVVANGSLPGPEIIVYEGQLLKINVINNLMSESTTIHWHGLHQRGTPWMDGLGFITQCPILPNTEFLYQFYARPKGTFWYHSHIGTQRTKGLFGALIIREKSTEHLKEHIMTINGWNHLWDSDTDRLARVYLNRNLQEGSVSLDGTRYSRQWLTSALINGKGRYYNSLGDHNGAPLTVFSVEPNQQYRFRIIGTGSQFPFQISIDSHILKVVASDGFDFTPVFVDAIIVNPGERYDVIISTNATEKRNYWIRAQTLEANYVHKAEAILRYTDAPDQDPSSEKRNCTANDRCLVINCPFTYFPENYYTDCKRFDSLRSNTNYDPAPDDKDGDFEEYFFNFGFAGRRGSSVNGRKFKLPQVSALTQPHELNTPCDATSGCSEETVCTCTHSLTLRFNKTIQMVITNMGNGASRTHPIHMHGYSFYVVKMGYGV